MSRRIGPAGPRIGSPLQFHDFGFGQVHRALQRRNDTSYLNVTVHLATSKSPPTWEQLAKYPWVLPPHDSLLRQPLLIAFASYGVEPPTNFVESLSLNVTLNYLQSSSAIASLPASLARKYSALNALSILPVKLPRLVRPVGLLWLRSHELTDGDRLFVRCVEEAARELAVEA